MPQNKSNLIKKFIGVSGNVISHRILLKSEMQEEIRDYYFKEIQRDTEVALSYRNSLNPLDRIFPMEEGSSLKRKILLYVRSRLLKRKRKGYQIDFANMEEEVETFLKEVGIL